MTLLRIEPSFVLYPDVDGQPLEQGYVYIGTAGLEASANQISVYYDEALTDLATQPLRTAGGFIQKSGAPANLYVGVSDYSLTIQNKNTSAVRSSLNTATADFSTMQIAYDGGSLATTNATNGALQIKRGSAADTDSVFQIQNGAGTVVANAQADNKIGLGMSTTTPYGNLHIRSASAGATTPSTSGDELILEGSGHVGASFIGGAGSSCTLYMGDAAANTDGAIQYNNSTRKLFLVSGGVNSITSDSTQQVGIGEEVPLGKLHVKTADAGVITVSANADELVVEGSANSGMTIHSGSANVGYLMFGSSTDNDEGQISYNHSSSSMSFGVNAATAVTIDSSQNMGVGEGTPLGKLHVKSGDAGAMSPAATADELILENSGDCGVSIISGTSSTSNILLGDNGDVDAGRITYTNSSHTLGLYTNNTLALSFDTNQIATFAAQVDVNYEDALITIDSSDHAASTPALVIKDVGGAYGGVINFQTVDTVLASVGRQASQSYVSISTADGTIALDVNSKQIIGVPTTPGGANHASSKAYVDFAVSDEKFKTNVNELVNSKSLSLVNSINAVSFNWDADKANEIGKSDDVDVKINGFIAQQVEAVIPEAVKTIPAIEAKPAIEAVKEVKPVAAVEASEGVEAVEEVIGVKAVMGQAAIEGRDSYKAIRRDSLVPIMWSAIQELSAKVATLEA